MRNRRRGLLWLEDSLAFVLVLFLALPLWSLPWKWSAVVSRFYGYCVFHLCPHARRVSLIGLKRAYGKDLTFEQAVCMTREIFGSLAQNFAELLQLARKWKHSAPSCDSLYQVEDPELENRIAGDFRPKIFVLAHLGSWEAAALRALSKGETPLAVVVRPVDNSLLERFVRWIRLRSFQLVIVEKRGAVAQCLRSLRNLSSILLLADENGGRKGVFVNFFGRLASTHRLPVFLSLTTGAPVVTVAALRTASPDVFNYRLAVLEPSDYECDPAAVRRMTQDMTSILERWIRENPEQWRWIHWRWKTRPDGNEESYGWQDLKECYGGVAWRVPAAKAGRVQRPLLKRRSSSTHPDRLKAGEQSGGRT